MRERHHNAQEIEDSTDIKVYPIGKYSKNYETMEEVGNITIDENDTVILTTRNKYLKGWLSSPLKHGFTISEGCKGLNQEGHPVYADWEKVIHPRNPEFAGAIKNHLPGRYDVIDRSQS